MIRRIATLGLFILASLALADDDASRAKLMGSWQAVADNGKDATTWTFSEKGETLHITASAAGRTVMEFDCDSFGHECTIKDSGKPAKVSWWYLGPKLINMETKGPLVLKRSFVITGDGDTMEMEQVQIAPSPKTETVKYKRESKP